MKARTVARFYAVRGQDHIVLVEVDPEGHFGPSGPVVAVTTSREATVAAMRLLCGQCVRPEEPRP